MNDEYLDSVNHPPHYQGKIECIDVIEDVLDSGGWDASKSYLLGNVIKYLYRAGKKNNRVVDLKKAQWYLNRLVSSYND